ncbi:MAG: TIR domain-containing protein [Rhodanobacteraceae bacterium]|nr:MAG: TIR domain-containing protein [Rhodanobacteraceae bacterium]
MADVFVSYARADKVRVAPLVAAIEAKGWSVWWDPEISPGREFDDAIDGELQAAKAVLVVWTPTSVVSRWVRGEARDAADRNVLVPVRFEQARLPIDVRAIHTIDLDDWGEDPASTQVQTCLHALAAMIAHSSAAQTSEAKSRATAPVKKEAPHYSVCVLPFANMSGDPEQEYFSDGISEDIITDLNKVSALEVVSRNTAFAYKGKQMDASAIARKLKVTHVLEGSVRRAGGRVRITAQLTDATNDRQVWAERFDRDTDDIFALQDEISHAIVKALRLQLLPEERRAIRRRGTDSVEAHDLYLMARQIYVTTQEDERASQAIIRACQRATEIDPHYAQAWALLAWGQRSLSSFAAQPDDGMTAVDKALALDPELAEAHAVKADILRTRGLMDAAVSEAATALKLDPESYEANRVAGRIAYMQHRFKDAVAYYEKTLNLMDSDVNSAMMLVSCYRALGDAAGRLRAAAVAVQRADAVLAHDQNNVAVIAFSANALSAAGEPERASVRMNRALLVDPDNFGMRYNFACGLCVYQHDKGAALDMLEPLFPRITGELLRYLQADPDFDSLHDDPRWQAMVAAAEARLAAAKQDEAPEPEQA